MGSNLCYYKKENWSDEDSVKAVKLRMLIKYLNNVEGNLTDKKRYFEPTQQTENGLGPITEESKSELSFSEEITKPEEQEFAAEFEQLLRPIMFDTSGDEKERTSRELVEKLCKPRDEKPKGPEFIDKLFEHIEQASKKLVEEQMSQHVPQLQIPVNIETSSDDSEQSSVELIQDDIKHVPRLSKLIMPMKIDIPADSKRASIEHFEEESKQHSRHVRTPSAATGIFTARDGDIFDFTGKSMIPDDDTDTLARKVPRFDASHRLFS